MKKLILSEIVNTGLIVMVILACFMQIFIDDSSDNIACACVALVGSLCALCYLRYSNGLQTHPISSFVIFGFSATTQMGALLVQSVSLHSISKDLRQPLDTFLVLAGFQIVAIAAHMTYRFFSAKSTQPDPEETRYSFSTSRLLERIGAYAIPSPLQLWIMGMIGVVALIGTGNSNTDQTLINRICAGVNFLAWAPFLIPIYGVQSGKRYCNVKVQYGLVVLFSLFIALLGMAVNARYMILSGAATLAFITLLTAMRSDRVVTFTQIFIAALLLCLSGLMLIPIADLATAMIVVRQKHHTMAHEKVLDTLDVFQRPELILAQRKKDHLAALVSNYDEVYVENPVLARFVMTKFHDNALFFESRLTEHASDELAKTTTDLLWAILPDPVLKYLDIGVVKKQLHFSMGDYLYHQVTGGAMGGFKVGSIFGQGIGLFGWFFSVVYFGICLISFWVLDLLTNMKVSTHVVVSAAGMLLIWRLYMYGITAESISDTVGFLFREIPQSVLIFVLFYKLTGGISQLFVMAEHLRPMPAYLRREK